MEAVNTIITAIVHNRPVAEMTYVALVAIGNMNDGPGINVIVLGDAIAPAAETYRLP
jgi:hypothetical protein